MTPREPRTTVRSVVRELELDRVVTLVAAFAQTQAAAKRLRALDGLPTPADAATACQLTDDVAAMIADVDGPMSFAGLDEAIPWLDPAAPLANDPKVLLDLTQFADRVDQIRRRLLSVPQLADHCALLPECGTTVRWIQSRLEPDGSVPDNATPELARWRQRIVHLRHEITRQLEALRRAHPTVVSDAPPTVRRGRYCLPVRANLRAQLPGLVLDTSASGSTVFLEPFAAVEVNNALAESLAGAEAEVARIIDEVAAAVGALLPELRTAAEVLTELDMAQARARFGRAVEGHVIAPRAGARMVLRQARHPLLDPRLATLRHQLFGEPEQLHQEVVPLDFELEDDARTLLISGPNAGGKTVVLKTLGVMVLMSFHGIPLPVADGTVIPEVSQVWTLIGDEQAVSSDLSTFSASMAALATILERCDHEGLVLIDELGTATDPLEGAALGAAVLEMLTRRAGLTVATTHLATLSLFAGSADGMVNAAMEFDDGRGGPTYAIRIGRPGRSHALEIARATGLEPSVVQRAEELLSGDHLQLERWLERLESLEADLVAQHSALAQERQGLGHERDRLEAARHELATARQEANRKLDEERLRLRTVAKKKLNAALASIDAAEQERRHLGRRARERLREQALQFTEPSSTPQTPSCTDLSTGQHVRLRALGGEGTIEEIRGQRARVATRGKRIWIEVSQLEASQAAQTKPERATSVTTEDQPERELKLIGMDALSARDELERFLDRAWSSGLSSVRIVHGHGTGALRSVVRDLCREHPAVTDYRHPPQHRGGTGATEVELDSPENPR